MDEIETQITEYMIAEKQKYVSKAQDR